MEKSLPKKWKLELKLYIFLHFHFFGRDFAILKHLELFLVGPVKKKHPVGVIGFPPPDGPKKLILKGILIQVTGRTLSRF